jgi:polyisoprenoid-binding protein YceI
MTATDFQTVPQYVTGTWAIDPIHSDVSFSVRHLVVSKVRGRFGAVSGTFVTADDPLASSVNATIELASIDTGNPDRDAHVRSADFLDVEQYPELVYRSTGVRADGDGYIVDGELTLHGVTRPVPLVLEVNGFQPTTPFGDTRAGFTATAEIDRQDFGITFNMPLDSGGVGLGNKIAIQLEIQAILQPSA